MSPKPGWLERQLKRITEEAEQWPAWLKREALESALVDRIPEGAVPFTYKENLGKVTGFMKGDHILVTDVKVGISEAHQRAPWIEKAADEIIDLPLGNRNYDVAKVGAPCAGLRQQRRGLAAAHRRQLRFAELRCRSFR